MAFLDMTETLTNYLTVDVEEYYQVTAFEEAVSVKDWDGLEPRVERSTMRMLDLLDVHDVKATFFVVGWIAERRPELVREIVSRGHSVGSHSYLHRRIYHLSADEFRADTAKSKEVIERIVGHEISGYRAPSYSITKKSMWALAVLEECGFKYDSSIFPIHHDLYGVPDAPRFRHTHDNLDLQEFPISTARVFGKNIPVAGGGYFRLFPYWMTRMLLKGINEREGQPFVFYVHPWEIDPDQPRFSHAGALSKFRHYQNLHRTYDRLERLLGDFSFGPIEL